MNEEPTIGDVLLAIANLDTRIARLEIKVDQITTTLLDLAMLFARHLEGHA